jgi:WbqC-like protein family
MINTVAIHQPAYLPWFGLIDKIARCDRFVVLDNVQYNARSFQHRTLYSTDSGPKYLSLSVNSSGHQTDGRTIREMQLLQPDLPTKHFVTLKHRYGKRPGWRIVGPRLEDIMCRPHQWLLNLDYALIRLTLDLFAIATPCLMASDLESDGTKSDLMLSLTRAAGGQRYLSGQGARAYNDPALFERSGIELSYQQFQHPTFGQSHGGDFQEGCFALEWLIEEPLDAVAKFHDHLRSHGAPQPGPSAFAPG